MTLTVRDTPIAEQLALTSILRRCSKCGTNKPLDEFYVVRSHGQLYRQRRCKACARKVAKEWLDQHPAERKAAWRKFNRDPETKRRKLLRTYGLEDLDLAVLEAIQQGLCWLCGKYVGDRLVIDHDHQTGTVRQLLCTRCNLGLGIFDDSPRRLVEAALYIARFRN